MLKKCREHPDDVLFIDVSKGFDKKNNQNELSKEHINKIVETFRTRKAIDKYSHLAPLTEIAENDYNLNIPRYVDTFEEETPVDLKTVSKDLVALEKEINKTDKTIAKFCKELKIKTPF